MISIHSGSVSSPAVFLTGLPLSTGLNMTPLVLGVNTIIAFVSILFAYRSNTHYLKHKHALIIKHETPNPRRNLISLKGLAVGCVLWVSAVLAVLIIQNLSPQLSELQVIIMSYTQASVVLYYAKNKKVLDHAHHILKQVKDSSRFTTLQKINVGRQHKISPEPQDLETA